LDLEGHGIVVSGSYPITNGNDIASSHSLSTTKPEAGSMLLNSMSAGGKSDNERLLTLENK